MNSGALLEFFEPGIHKERIGELLRTIGADAIASEAATESGVSMVLEATDNFQMWKFRSVGNMCSTLAVQGWVSRRGSCVALYMQACAFVAWHSLEAHELAARWQEERQQPLATDADVTLG